MSKITNPVVLIHKRENSDTYAVAITSGSTSYQDAILMASMEPDMTGDDIDTWSKTGYYMAAEIEHLRAHKQSEYPELLPCTVELKPGLVIGKGCKTETLLHALQRRADYQVEIDAMTPEERAEHDANIEAFKAMLPAPVVSASSERTTIRRSAEHKARLSEASNLLAKISPEICNASKPLSITLPDIRSKAFWSGTGKSETFHPETYRRWVKEAIERYCVSAGIGVEVK